MAVEDLGPSIWFGDASGDSLGLALSIPADLDGDGLSDLLMGAPMVDQDRLNVRCEATIGGKSNQTETDIKQK